MNNKKLMVLRVKDFEKGLGLNSFEESKEYQTIEVIEDTPINRELIVDKVYYCFERDLWAKQDFLDGKANSMYLDDSIDYYCDGGKSIELLTIEEYEKEMLDNIAKIKEQVKNFKGVN